MGTVPPYDPQDPRSAARQARDYARAQRAYWRSYRGSCRRSMVRPVVLIVVGVLALLVETGRIPAEVFWSWFGHWWPLLLIALGVLLLLEYLIDRNNPNAGRGAGGIVWLVIWLVIIGWSVNGARDNWRWFGPGNRSFWSMMGPQYNHTVQLTQPLKVAKGVIPIVNIEDPHGAVTVTASTDGMIHLTARQAAYTGSQQDADREFGATTPTIEATSTGANIVAPARDDTSDDLTLELPAASGAVIQSGHGDVTVEGLNGSVDVTAHRGDVRLDQLGSDVHARMHHGDFSAQNVKGQALVEGSGGDVTLSQIGGDAAIHGEFTGDVHLQQVSGTVSFQSSRTQITVPKLAGQMTLDSGDLGMDRASGPIVIVAKAKNIDLSAITGDVQITDSDGDVSLAMAQPLGNITIANRTGGVRLQMPPNAGFQIKASTSSEASLSSDFPLTESTSHGVKTLQGKIGAGGAMVELTTTHGSMEIAKGTTDTASPAQAAGKTAPHFKTQKPVHATVQ